MKLSDPCVTKNAAHSALAEILPLRLADRESEYEALLLANSMEWTLGQFLDAMVRDELEQAKAAGAPGEVCVGEFMAAVDDACREGRLSMEVALLLLDHAHSYVERLSTRERAPESSVRLRHNRDDAGPFSQRH